MDVVIASKGWCKPYTMPSLNNIFELLTEQYYLSRLRRISTRYSWKTFFVCLSGFYSNLGGTANYLRPY